jgi:predicted Zn-dependent protease
VVALVSQADKHIKMGQLNPAVVNIERALRIEPRNATLTYKLATLRLKQLKPRLAENIARKAALLAAGDKELKKKSWLLIAQARHLQQNYTGAKEAELKAQSLD